MRALQPTGFEPSDADARLIGAIAFGLAFFLLVTPLALLAIYPEAARMVRLPSGLPQPPAPRLQVEPAADTNRLHATERGQLAQSGWVDRERGIVRIPLERAIELLAARGMPGWPSRP